MTLTNDRIWMCINRSDTTIRGSAGFRPVLERLDRSFLPHPTSMEARGKERKVTGYLDQVVLTALDRTQWVKLLGDGIKVDAIEMRQRTTLSVRFLPGPPAAEIRALFVDLVDYIQATYACCRLDAHGSSVHHRFYRDHPRTFYADGLYWLNYFGPDEQARQGGPALADNPHAHVERRAHGLLLEVGDDPLEASTPAGEQRLRAATAAMPPLPGIEKENVEPDSTPAELITVGGQRGFLDPVDHGFWVTKHVVADATLDRRTIKRLQGLRGQGDPPIQQVHVLFSLEPAARRNKAALEVAGVKAWFVSLETGTPQEA
jgi:hypothetical protein